ncbi:MAG TPA: DNA transposition protein [Ancylobacter sp.]
MTRRRDIQTIDMFSEWTPPAVVERYDERAVQASTWRDRIAKAVKQTLDSSDLSRDEIAVAMSDWLGESVTKGMLDNYSSQAKEEHTISFQRVIALCMVTGDPRLLQLAVEPLGRAVIEERYLGAIQEAMAVEQMEHLERMRKISRRQWRGR